MRWNKAGSVLTMDDGAIWVSLFGDEFGVSEHGAQVDRFPAPFTTLEAAQVAICRKTGALMPDGRRHDEAPAPKVYGLDDRPADGTVCKVIGAVKEQGLWRKPEWCWHLGSGSVRACAPGAPKVGTAATLPEAAALYAAHAAAKSPANPLDEALTAAREVVARLEALRDGEA